MNSAKLEKAEGQWLLDKTKYQDSIRRGDLPSIHGVYLKRVLASYEIYQNLKEKENSI